MSMSTSLRRTVTQASWGRALLGGVASTTLASALLSGSAAAQVLAPQPAAGAQPLTVVASIHFRSPDSVLTALRGYLPVAPNATSLLKDLVGDLNPQVTMAAPAEVLVALDPGSQSPDRPIFGYSLSIANFAETQKIAQARGFIEGAAGSGPVRLKVQSSSGRSIPCLLAATGGVGGRLACAERERDRDSIAPLLLKTRPPAGKSDLHAELRVDNVSAAFREPLQRYLQVGAVAVPKKLQLGQPMFDRALTDLTQILIEQIRATTQELKFFALDVSLTQNGAEARLGYRIDGKSSLWAQADAEDSARPASGAPPAYFALPADSTSASFTTTDAKFFWQLLGPLSQLLEGYLTHENLAAADRQALVDVIAKLPKPEGPIATVVSEGRPVGSAKGDVGLVGLFGGGAIVTFTEGQDQRTPWLRSLLAAVNRPGVQAFLKKKWKGFEPSAPMPTAKLGPAPKSLGPGALAAAFTLHLGTLEKTAALDKEKEKDAAGAGKPITVHVLVAPQKGGVYTALGTDRDRVLRRLEEHFKLPPERTLEKRPGLEVLRQPGVRSGGYTTLLSFGSYLESLLTIVRKRGAAKDASSLSGLYNTIPHHGETPILYFGTRGSDSGLTREYHLQVPRAAIEDTVALFLAVAMEK